MKKILLVAWVLLLSGCNLYKVPITEDVKRMDWKTESVKDEGNAKLCMFREKNLWVARGADIEVYLLNRQTEETNKIAVLSNDDFVCINRKKGMYQVIVPQWGWDDLTAEVYLKENKTAYVNFEINYGTGLVIRVEPNDERFKRVKQ